MDVAAGGDGADRLTGGMDGDRLYGGRDADALMGGMGNDYLDEGAGHGDLEGGMGDDTLVGGLGPDAFAVDPTSGNDVIRDFTAGPGMFDHLALRDIRPDQVSVVDRAEGAFVSWNTDRDADPEGGVLLLGVFRADLRQSDFMFIDEPGFVPGISTAGSDWIFPA